MALRNARIGYCSEENARRRPYGRRDLRYMRLFALIFRYVFFGSLDRALLLLLPG